MRSWSILSSLLLLPLLLRCPCRAAVPPAPGISPQTGEIQVQGTVREVPAAGKLVIDVVNVTLPGGQGHLLSPPRQKTVAWDANTSILGFGGAQAAAEVLVKGVRMSAVGKDSGQGGELPARAIFIGVFPAPPGRAAAGPLPDTATVEEVLVRSRQAYAALKSFDGTVTVVETGTSGSTPVNNRTTARIRWSAPNRLRVDTTGFFSHKPVSFGTDGRRIWQGAQGMDVRKGAVEIVELITPCSQAHTLATVLLRTGRVLGGNPLYDTGYQVIAMQPGMEGQPEKIAPEVLNGRRTFRITLGDMMTCWVDRGTWFLVQVQRRDEGTVTFGEVTAKVNTRRVETYSAVKLNQPIPASVFAAPPGAVR